MSCRVLVVDDELFFRELIGNVLEEAGFTVRTAASAEEALSLFAAEPVPVAVVDLVLPDMVGTDLLARLREADPELAVVMVTAYASLESAINALKSGAYDFIQKPIVREDLVSAVERAAERQHLHARNRALVAELEGRLADLARVSREKEEVFRTLHDGLVLLDPEGRIRDLNPRAASLLGKEGALLAGRLFEEAAFPLEGFSPGDAPGDPSRAEVEHAFPDGHTRVLALALAPFSAGGEGAALLALSDITEKRGLERRKDEFLSIVSHDLRTPLTSLKGFIELLLAGKYENGQVLREYLAILDAEADRMIGLINDLLDLSRLDEGRMELFPEELAAEELVLYAQRSMEGLGARRGVELVLADPGGWHLLRGDRQRLIQVLTNLYANAIRFSPRGGKVETGVSSREGTLTLTVSDQGPGIPPAERERIFDKYRQLRDSAPERARGSGLGLTIVRRVVELHGGTVHVEDAPGGPGSRFVVTLPSGEAR